MMKSILTHSRKHDISFHPSGKIDISAHIARRLSLAPGDVIGIAREEDEMYLYVKLRAGHYNGRHDGRVWATAHGKGTFRTRSKALTSALFAATGEDATLRCPCGMEVERAGIKYLTIIFRRAL